MAVEHWQCKSGLYFRSIFRILFFIFNNYKFLSKPLHSVCEICEGAGGRTVASLGNPTEGMLLCSKLSFPLLSLQAGLL